MYLEHCKNFGESAPEWSYNEGKSELISSHYTQRRNKWEHAVSQQVALSDSKQQRQSRDLNLDVPNPLADG